MGTISIDSFRAIMNDSSIADCDRINCGDGAALHAPDGAKREIKAGSGKNPDTRFVREQLFNCVSNALGTGDDVASVLQSIKENLGLDGTKDGAKKLAKPLLKRDIASIVNLADMIIASKNKTEAAPGAGPEVAGTEKKAPVETLPGFPKAGDSEAVKQAKAFMKEKEDAAFREVGWTVGGKLSYSVLGAVTKILLKDKDYIAAAGVIKDEFGIQCNPPKVEKVQTAKTSGPKKFPFVEMFGSAATVLRKLSKIAPGQVGLQVFGDGTHLGGTLADLGQEEFSYRSSCLRAYAALIASGAAEFDGKHINFAANEVGLQKYSTIDGFWFDTTVTNIDGLKLADDECFNVKYFDSSSPSFASQNRTNTDDFGDLGWLWKCRATIGKATDEVAKVPEGKQEEMSSEVRNSLAFIRRLLDIQFPKFGSQEFDHLVNLSKLGKFGDWGLERKAVYANNLNLESEGLFKIPRFHDAVMIALFAADELRENHDIDMFKGPADEQMEKFVKLIGDGKYKALLEKANANYEKTIEAKVEDWVKSSIDKGVRYLVGGAPGCGWFVNEDERMAKIYARVFCKYAGQITYVYANMGKADEKNPGKMRWVDAHVGIWKQAFEDEWSKVAADKAPEEVGRDRELPTADQAGNALQRKCRSGVVMLASSYFSNLHGKEKEMAKAEKEIEDYCRFVSSSVIPADMQSRKRAVMHGMIETRDDWVFDCTLRDPQHHRGAFRVALAFAKARERVLNPAPEPWVDLLVDKIKGEKLDEMADAFAEQVNARLTAYRSPQLSDEETETAAGILGELLDDIKVRIEEYLKTDTTVAEGAAR